METGNEKGRTVQRAEQLLNTVMKEVQEAAVFLHFLTAHRPRSLV
jgi:hypothetical protein